MRRGKFLTKWAYGIILMSLPFVKTAPTKLITAVLANLM